MVEKEGFSAKPRRLIINGNQQKKGPMIMSQAEDDKFRKQNQQIGKIVFLKDRDIE
jgi:hypothetical protein